MELYWCSDLFIPNTSSKLSRGDQYNISVCGGFSYCFCKRSASPAEFLGVEMLETSTERIWIFSFLLGNNTEPHWTLIFVLIAFCTESDFVFTFLSPLGIIQLAKFAACFFPFQFTMYLFYVRNSCYLYTNLEFLHYSFRKHRATLKLSFQSAGSEACFLAA